MNVHALRSAGWSGLAFIVMVLITGFLPAPLSAPDINGAPAAIGAYIDAQHMPLLASGWLSFIAVGFLLWFAVGLFNYQAAAPGEQEGLPIFALANAIIASGLALLSAVVEIGMAFYPAADLGAPLTKGLYVLYQVGGTFTDAPAALFIWAVSYSGARHASLPNWLVWLGYIVGLLLAIASASVLFSSGFLALGGIGGLFIGLLPFGVWFVATGIWMIRKHP